MIYLEWNLFIQSLFLLWIICKGLIQWGGGDGANNLTVFSLKFSHLPLQTPPPTSERMRICVCSLFCTRCCGYISDVSVFRLIKLILPLSCVCSLCGKKNCLQDPSNVNASKLRFQFLVLFLKSALVRHQRVSDLTRKEANGGNAWIILLFPWWWRQWFCQHEKMNSLTEWGARHNLISHVCKILVYLVPMAGRRRTTLWLFCVESCFDILDLVSFLFFFKNIW